jgi:hypothetical protein
MTTFASVYQNVNPNNPKRKANDFYPTAPTATYSLCRVEDVPRRVLEPAAGRGHIVHELRRLGHEVEASDLHRYDRSLVDDIRTGVDFLSVDGRWDAVVTNPPYIDSLAEKFARKALAVSGYLAMFVRLTFLEAKGRGSWFRGEGRPSRVWIFSGRLSCDEDMIDAGLDLGGIVAYAWFVWDRRVQALAGGRATELDWIDLDDMYGRRQAEVRSNLAGFFG